MTNKRSWGMHLLNELATRVDVATATANSQQKIVKLDCP